jgi:hypothetical protein
MLSEIVNWAMFSYFFLGSGGGLIVLVLLLIDVVRGFRRARAKAK